MMTYAKICCQNKYDQAGISYFQFLYSFSFLINNVVFRDTHLLINE